ncbi:MAG TPA: hydrogenase maturation peptidase HycI [Candidatus Omnitrophota bacterium]|nr:hydrogenase maturation peptidase HycI [Candidatus Omnitrophota bacterium]HPD84223.1 hydrogenase maturation peptidase HycI [Candidatus Omnitrophota bacterium]HRZ03079.1 hydrogenase maturation peptidase HycI [Candidatus Omnitrophota bacterium]
MPSLKTQLKSRLAKAKRIVILGVGSELRGDDVAGMLVVKTLKKSLSGNKKIVPIKIIFGGVSPENFTGAIKRFKPSHLVIIDSADLGRKAGTVDFLDVQNIGGVTFNTHKLPTRFMVEYLLVSEKFSVTIIGIQPKTISFMAPVSQQAKKAVGSLAGTLKSILTHQ